MGSLYSLYPLSLPLSSWRSEQGTRRMQTRVQTQWAAAPSEWSTSVSTCRLALTSFPGVTSFACLTKLNAHHLEKTKNQAHATVLSFFDPFIHSCAQLYVKNWMARRMWLSLTSLERTPLGTTIAYQWRNRFLRTWEFL